MYKIDLTTIPNQIFTVMLEGVEYKIQLRTIQNQTYMSCWANNELLFYSQLCTPNNYVNPYNYVSINGKFYFECLDNEYPYFENFNTTQNLYFYTTEEIKQNA